jgi:O-antigen/teichoic acid export membrane protein
MIACKCLLLVAGLATTVIAARALGPGGRGVVAVSLGFSIILRQIGTLGLATANPYFLARNGAHAHQLVINSAWLAVSLGMILGITGVALKVGAPGVVPGVPWSAYLLALASIPFALAALFLQSILLGLGRTTAYNLVEVGQEVLIALAMAVALFPLHRGPTAAVALLGGGYVVSTAVYFFLLRGHRGASSKPDLGLARSMVAYAFRIYMATLLAFLVIRLDLVLVNAYRGSADAGIYSVDAALAGGMYIIPSVIAINLFVRVARGREPALTATIFRLVALVYGALCLLAVALAGPFIHLLYGPRFSEAISVFYWLIPGVFALGMLTILAHHFAGRGFPLNAMLVWVVGLAVNLVINVALLPKHGIWVAAMSSSVAYTMLLVLHMRLFARDIGGYRAMVPSLKETWYFIRLAVDRCLAYAKGRRVLRPPQAKF